MMGVEDFFLPVVRQDVAIALGLAIDLAALRGTGTDNQPLGIANTPGILNVILGDNGGLADFDTFTDMEYELSVDNDIGALMPRTRSC